MTYLYAAIAVAGALLGGLVAHLFDSGRYSHLQIEYANYKGAVAAQQAIDQLAARTALQAQVDNAHRIAQENDRVLSDLHAKLAESDRLRATDRTTVSSLLRDAAAQTCPTGNQLPKGPGKPADTGPDLLDQVSDLLSRLAAEDKANADKLDATNSQLKGQ
jgi:hypothetical protein